MQYRTFGKLDYRPSALGLGAMRLPLLDDGTGQPPKDFSRIDEERATEMLRVAVDLGVNYIDTAYPYHEGASEVWLGRALQDGYRERVQLATKLPTWLVKSSADFDRYLDEQLVRLQTGTIDFYLLHSLDADSWPLVLEHDILRRAEQALAEGRIGHFGFSFHDQYDLFAEIVAATDLWEFCQIQYNYMDEDYQAGRRGLDLAAGKGLGVVVMEPLRGGGLARNLPPAAGDLLDGATPRRSAAEWALRWVWDQPEVSLVLSGMSTLEQVEQNCAAAAGSGTGVMTVAEREMIAAVRDVYATLVPLPCTSCRYCLPCPQGVDIPGVFELFNDAHIYGEPFRQRLFYGWLDDTSRADRCTARGQCEPLCPQSIEIIAELEKVHTYLNEKKD